MLYYIHSDLYVFQTVDDRICWEKSPCSSKMNGASGSNSSSTNRVHGCNNAYVVCNFWYIDALHSIGRHDEARELVKIICVIVFDLLLPYL